MRKRKLVMLILSLLVAGAGLVFTACSSDNDEPKPDVPQEPSVKLDADTIQVFEGLTVKFQMLNADSLPVTTFKEGENITFMLVVTNSREEMVAIPNIIDMLGTNTFNIYTAQGEDLGRPWDARIGLGLANLETQPGQYYQITCPAFGEVENPLMFDSASYNPWADPWGTWCIFFKTEYARKPLPKGSYYTQFEINLNNGVENPSKGYKGVMCRKEFRIE